MSRSVLVAGIGNIFNRDDGFGVAVASRLAERGVPDGVHVVDFGIRGFDLVLALLEGPDLAIFVDAVSRGGAPGNLYVIEPHLDEIGDEDALGIAENAHGLNPVKVLRLAKSLGASPGRIIVVGCEPATLGDDTGRIGLSEAVEAAIEPAIDLILSLVKEDQQDRTEAGVRIRKACTI